MSSANEVSDALSETTRAERRSLLASSVVLVALSWGGLVPAKISALGLDVDHVNSKILVALALGINLYFLCAFIFYYRADLYVAERQLQKYTKGLTDEDRNLFAEKLSRDPGTGGNLDATLARINRRRVKQFIRLRYGFDFWSAVGIGAGAALAAGAWLLRHVSR
jgi:hypothetical protein